MQYDRFLDIHFVTSTPTDLSRYQHDPKKLKTKTKAQRLGTYAQGKYQYDFQGDLASQTTVYIKKLQDKFDDGPPQVVFDRYGQPGLAAVQAKGKNINDVLGAGTNPAVTNPNQFDKLHYISCYVDLETLQPSQPFVSEFAELVAWISAAATSGKIRLNCHGNSAADAGFSMGGSTLSPADLVEALIRHGLKKGSPDDLAPHTKTNESYPGASWKPNNKAPKCENRKCAVAFGFVTRRHHCRRCGGIFCDKCTKKRQTVVNPLTETGHAAGAVPDCRVCDDCAHDANYTLKFVKASKGVTQITLALCLSARNETELADMKTGFARNSIASRLVQALREHHLLGIQVSGMNEVLKWSDQGFIAVFGVKYPGQAKDKKAGIDPGIDLFAGTDFAGSLSTNVSLTIPSSILGGRNEPGERWEEAIIDAAQYIPVRDMKITPCCGGNKLAFGIFTAAQERLVTQAFKKWDFHQWVCIEAAAGSVPELSQATGILSEWRGPTGPNAAFLTKARFGRSTKLLSAPQWRIHIEWAKNDPNSIVVRGLEERSYKQYKVFELT